MGKRGTIAIFIVIALAAVLLIAMASIIPRYSPQQTKVLLETTQGNIVIELYSDMPITAGNFSKLVSEGFYDGILFHRVIPNFVIQAGDPLTKDPAKKNLWGTGGPGYTIKDELKDHSNKKGTIAMANSGPGTNTGGSQFFINLVDNIFLDEGYPVFGEVVEGFSVVETIAAAETDSADTPLNEIRIIRATIVQ